MLSDAESTITPQRLLFVEDDSKLSAFLCRYFTEQGYEARTASDGDTMRQALQESPADMVVLDIGLPGRDDGYALARELTRDQSSGVLFLSARQELIDRIIGLEIGADDYLVKPFEPRELLARIRAVLRRLPSSRPADAQPVPEADPVFDNWQLDLSARMLRNSDGGQQSLTTQEFNLLSALAQRPGQVLSRDRLMDLTVGRDRSPLDRSIDVMIGKVRRKIRDRGPHYRRIQTIRGVGYMFSPDD